MFDGLIIYARKFTTQARLGATPRDRVRVGATARVRDRLR